MAQLIEGTDNANFIIEPGDANAVTVAYAPSSVGSLIKSNQFINATNANFVGRLEMRYFYSLKQAMDFDSGEIIVRRQTIAIAAFDNLTLQMWKKPRKGFLFGYKLYNDVAMTNFTISSFSEILQPQSVLQDPFRG